jgi:hypothetical protein
MPSYLWPYPGLKKILVPKDDLKAEAEVAKALEKFILDTIRENAAAIASELPRRK